MVLVSHNPADIRSLSDEVFRMDHGRIVGQERIDRSEGSP